MATQAGTDFGSIFVASPIAFATPGRLPAAVGVLVRSAWSGPTFAPIVPEA